MIKQFFVQTNFQSKTCFLQIFRDFLAARGRLDPFGSIQIHPEAIRSDSERFEKIEKNRFFFRVKFSFFVIFGPFWKSYSKTDVTMKILRKNYADRLILRFVRLKKGFDMVKYVLPMVKYILPMVKYILPMVKYILPMVNIFYQW